MAICGNQIQRPGGPGGGQPGPLSTCQCCGLGEKLSSKFVRHWAILRFWEFYKCIIVKYVWNCLNIFTYLLEIIGMQSLSTYLSCSFRRARCRPCLRGPADCLNAWLGYINGNLGKCSQKRSHRRESLRQRLPACCTLDCFAMRLPNWMARFLNCLDDRRECIDKNTCKIVLLLTFNRQFDLSWGRTSM